MTFATVQCLLCHTVDAALSMAAVDGGASWRCARCGQRWDANRLAVVLDYQRWLKHQAPTFGVDQDAALARLH